MLVQGKLNFHDKLCSFQPVSCAVFNRYLQPVFYKAFQIEKKIGYAIEAGMAYFDHNDIHAAVEIIKKIKEIEPSFPRDNYNKLWTSKTIMTAAENQILKDNQKAIELLNSIEMNIDSLAQEKTKDYRMLKAKFCSLFGLIYSLSSEPIKAREFLYSSYDIVDIYKSVSVRELEMKELLFYNHSIEIILCNDNARKIEKLKRLECEFAGPNKKELMIKFGSLFRILKKSTSNGL